MRRIHARPVAALTGLGWIAVVLAVASAADAPARDGLCDRCGGSESVRTVCVKILMEKEVTKVCWGYRCEKVCIPGPSIFCGTRHHRDDCGCWTCWLWKPTCEEIITRHVPVKKEVRRKVPAVEWKVAERCCACRHATDSGVRAADEGESQEP